MTDQPTFLTQRADILVACKGIADEYSAQDLLLTVRQMYYQLVARGLLPSGQRHYKKIVSTLSTARYDGRFGLDLLEDRTRTVHRGRTTRNDVDPQAALEQAEGWIQNMHQFFLQRARWYGQPTHVSVWVEKEALAGIFQPTCEQLGVSWLACKGCPSVSALWDWIKMGRSASFEHESNLYYNYATGMPTVRQRHTGDAERCVILYFGDHDPTGFMIPRAAQEGINKIMETSRQHLDVTVKRVALNMDQVRQYNPPSFWAKQSDTRYRSYVEEHGTTECWELDALDPTVLRNLITSEVDALFDEDIHDVFQAEVEVARGQMLEMMRDQNWIDEVLGGV